MLDQIPEAGLMEAWQKLKQIRDFHAELAITVSTPQRQLPKPVKARLGRTYERPQVVLPDADMQ
jgi:hypothetical protein